MGRRYGGRFVYRLCQWVFVWGVFGALDMGDIMLMDNILAGIAVAMLAACIYEMLTMGGDDE